MMVSSSSSLNRSRSPAKNSFLVLGAVDAFLRHAVVQHKTQRIERLVIGVLARFAVPDVVILAHCKQEATFEHIARSAALHLLAIVFLALAIEFVDLVARRARLFPALLDELAFVKLAALDSGVAVDIGLPVSVCVGLGFRLGRHALKRRKQSLAHQVVDVLAPAVRSEAQHGGQPVGNIVGGLFESSAR